ncbi:hypothetical protein HAX54_047860 [Datura stramonium]|uniref:Ribulose bisphosphate carboxylase large subunit C-terminal domain-containing protein n=1 Tax=Datura stramonium TaxID=4076 RepID=A0ABS8SUH9_DATST|nr:hypothetical protein [Datura stramonium]
MTANGGFWNLKAARIAEIMVYFFTSTVQCMRLLIEQKNHGKLEGERDITLGFVDLLRDDFVEQDRSRGIYFLKIGSLYQCSTGGFRRYSRLAYACSDRDLGDDSVLQFGGGTLGHPWE